MCFTNTRCKFKLLIINYYISMIQIREISTGKVFKCWNASKSTATRDSFCTLQPITNRFRSNWNDVIDYFIQGKNDLFCQCLLKDGFEVVL